MGLPIPVPRDDRPYGEIARVREDDRAVWIIDRIGCDPCSDASLRIEVARRNSLREILADALEFERRTGGHVNRRGIAR